MSEIEIKNKALISYQEELITTPEELSQCCERLAACKRFGLDTEFVGEDTYHPRLCLIQVATETHLYLIDPQTVGELDAFWRLVVDPSNLVIVHAGREEVRLCHLWSGSTPGNLFDLQIAAGLVGYKYPLSHGNLVDQVLGVRLTKGETLTEWRNRPLTPAQIRYAFDDVRYLLPCWERLSLKLDKLDRLNWAREEFDRLRFQTVPQENLTGAVPDKWRKLRGAGTLDRRRLAILRELYFWREEQAARSNRPSRTIVRDDLLVEIARRNPTKVKDLQVVRGLPKRSLESILEAVRTARNIPLELCPEVAEQEQDPPQLGLVAHLLTAILGDLCVKERLANSLVASNQDLKLLIRSVSHDQPLSKSCLLGQGWRAHHILPRLQAVLEGKQGIRVKDLQAEAPFCLD